MNREEKQQTIEELRAELLTAVSVVVASNAGTTVNAINDLRTKLRASGAKFRVVKNTLASKAIAGTHLEKLDGLLVGPSALAFHAEDPSGPAKIILDFKKTNEKYVVRGGFIDGTILDEKGVELLSKMPGKNELRSQLLNIFTAVGTKFVRVLAAGPTSFVQVLKARENQLGGE
jgi:large subunit ribosomal protein L10